MNENEKEKKIVVVENIYAFLYCRCPLPMMHLKQFANSQQFDLTVCIICVSAICLSWKPTISLTHLVA